MKKKIIGLTIAGIVALTGVVSAASMWGTYKGNEIIRLTVDNRPILVAKGEVPAISYNNRTMVPVNLLKYAGINYTYDQKTKTVDIKTTRSQINQSVDPAQTTLDIIELGGGGVTLTKLNNQLTALVYYSKTSNADSDWLAIQKILIKLVDFDALYSRVAYIDGAADLGYVEAQTERIKSYRDGLIDENEMSKYTIFNGFDQPAKTTPGGITNNDTINSRIDGDFDGFEEGKIFKLQNGQIWEQTSYDYKYSYKYSPKVTIYKDGASYYMIVDGVDKKVKVERIK